MKITPKNYRDFERTLLAYFAETGASVELAVDMSRTEVKSEVTELISGVEYVPPKPELSENENAQNTWAPIEEKFSPGEGKAIGQGPYRTIIADFVGKIMPDQTQLISKERLINDSVLRFSAIYQREKLEFFGTIGELDARFRDSMDDIAGKTREELSLLRNAVGHDLSTQKEGAEVKNATGEIDRNLENMDTIDKREVKKQFDDYTDAMNAYYLNVDWQAANFRAPGEYEFPHIPIVWPDVKLTGKREFRESHRARIEEIQNSAERSWGIPIIYPNLDKNQFTEAYREKSEILGKALKKRAMAKVNYLLDQPDVTPKELQALRKEIQSDYERISGYDKNDGLIDLADIYAMEQLANGGLNILTMLNNDYVGMNEQLLEAFQLMNPDAWGKAIKLSADTFIEDAVNNGNQGNFLKITNKIREEKGQEPLESYRQAENYFRSELNEISKVGAREAVAYINKYNEGLNGKLIELLDQVTPKSIQGVVYKQRELLLSRRLIPESNIDRVVVEFVSTGKEGRELMLKERRSELFAAIKNIRTHYPKQYDANAVPKKIADLREDKKNMENPSMFDNCTRPARLQAMIVIAGEAEWLVENFGGSEEFKGQDLATELDDTKADIAPPYKATSFKDPSRHHAVPFRSALYRGGWNAGDLAVKGLKIFGALAVVINIANSVKSSDEEGFFNKVIDGVGKAVTNPSVLGGAAVATGAALIERYPQLKKYPWASDYGKAGIKNMIKLDLLVRERTGKESLNRFTSHPNEWEVMDKLTPSQSRALLKKARDRNAKDRTIPLAITNEDIAQYITDDRILTGLPEGGRHNGVRFKFYQTFLDTDQKQNIGQLREMCVRM